MDFINKLLTEDLIINNYAKIDSLNTTPSNHGMKHILGTLTITDRFAKTLNLSERDVEIIKTCLVFHDIGCASGREDHPYKSMLIVQDYFKNYKIFDDEELNIIYDAILHHDDFGDFSHLKTKIHWLVNLIDKLDFAASRLEDNYKQKFEYSESEDIDRLEFELENNIFKITIKTIAEPKVISAERIYNRNLICKAMIVFGEFCNNFGYTPKLFLEDEELYFQNFNKNVMMKR